MIACLKVMPIIRGKSQSKVLKKKKTKKNPEKLLLEFFTVHVLKTVLSAGGFLADPLTWAVSLK